MKKTLLFLLPVIIFSNTNIIFSDTEKISIKDIPEIKEIEIDKPTMIDPDKLNIFYKSPFTNPKYKFCKTVDKKTDNFLHVELKGGATQLVDGCKDVNTVISKSDFGTSITVKKSEDDPNLVTIPVTISDVSAGDIIWVFNDKEEKLVYIHKKSTDKIEDAIKKFVEEKENRDLFIPTTKSALQKK